jgi:hypothetical protein
MLLKFMMKFKMTFIICLFFLFDIVVLFLLLTGILKEFNFYIVTIMSIGIVLSVYSFPMNMYKAYKIYKEKMRFPFPNKEVIDHLQWIIDFISEHGIYDIKGKSMQDNISHWMDESVETLKKLKQSTHH